MALVWDPGTFQYVDTDEAALAAGLSGTGSIVSMLPAAQQYGLAAGAAFPRLQDQPYMQAAVSRAYQPLLGQYATTYGGFRGEDVSPEASFAQWLRGQGTTAGIQPGARGRMTPGTFGGAAPANWADIVNVARSMDPTFTGTAPGEAAMTRWQPALQDPATARALASYATYDPYAGTMFGRWREAGLERQQQAFLQERPGATGADWLGYITGVGGSARTPFQV